MQATTEKEHKFCTGSSYVGELDGDGKMTGYGTYRYPNGMKYIGHFKNGMFHGRGMIVHPSKFKMCGYFVNGKCDSYETFFGDGLEYTETDWTYCTEGDRRFWVEVVQGLSPVGETFLTKEKPSRCVPEGFYDNEEGLYDPVSGYIVSGETGEKIRYVCVNEGKRIIKHCRMNTIEFEEQEERSENKNNDISTDSWVSSDN